MPRSFATSAGGSGASIADVLADGFSFWTDQVNVTPTNGAPGDLLFSNPSNAPYRILGIGLIFAGTNLNTWTTTVFSLFDGDTPANIATSSIADTTFDTITATDKMHVALLSASSQNSWIFRGDAMVTYNATQVGVVGIRLFIAYMPS